MANVSQYYPGSFWSDVGQSLAWMFGQQAASVGGWEANALSTPTSAVLAECGIVSAQQLAGFAQTAVENIVINPPVGILPDSSPGPDGFPVNFSPIGLPTGNVLLNTFQNSVAQPLAGSCFNLQQAPGYYRVDVFARADVWYYQGSSALSSGAGGVIGWAISNCAPGTVLAVLYPASIPQPAGGSTFPTLPTGWVAHSNTGVGQKLTQYFARVYSKTDIEYLQEDNIPIIAQDQSHARCGSSVAPATGALTVHIVYIDPIQGNVEVYNSLETLAAYQGLPRSFAIPTSDPLYAQNLTLSNAPAFQNRSFIYDAALFVFASCGAGNFTAASKVIKQLNTLLDNPGYLASIILENGEDGNSARRWTKSNAADSVTDINDPSEPPYGAGLVVDFHATVANDSFSFSGPGLPDTTDQQVQFEHKESANAGFVFDIGLATSAAKVTDVQVTSAPAGPAVFNAGSKVITVPIGPGEDSYRTNLINLAQLIASLAADTLTGINSFKVTLTAAGDLYFDNLSVGSLQPANSLSFSYDIYNGQIDQPYIRTGAMAWVCYAYCVYMAASQDFSPALYLQRMLNFLFSLQSTASDLTNGLFYQGYGLYTNPGYQFVPGLIKAASTEHQVDLWFAFIRAADVLPTAATQLLKLGQITSAQATSLGATASQGASLAGVVWTKLSTNLYIPPGAEAGHFAQGASSSGLDTSLALDASGSWTALLADANGRDDIAAQCLQFVYQTFYLTGQTIMTSNAANTWNEAFQQLSPFSGLMPYGNSIGGYSNSPPSVWQEGTWGFIVALLRLYNVSAVSGAFASIAGSIDYVLATLISSQSLIRSTTGNGSFLAYSQASRGLPYEFEVWPALAPTAWFWIASVNPALVLSAATNPQTLPYLTIPQGPSQSVNETDGMASLGKVTVTCIDPGGVLKSLAAQQQLIGQQALLQMGFPGQSLGDFVTLHTLQITGADWTSRGQIQINCEDVQRFVRGSYLWLNGGPASWTPGMIAPTQPSGPSWLPNSYTAGTKNPRYVQGHPLDILLAALQNELGVGQDPSLPRSRNAIYSSDFSSSGELPSPVVGTGGWQIFMPGQDSTLINPNPYVDVLGILALRDGPFSGDWMEFKITQKTEALQWIEDQVLKVLGLYFIIRSNGQIALKSMKSPQVLTPSLALNATNITGIPQAKRGKVINVLNIRMDVNDQENQTAAMQYNNDVTFEQQDSIQTYRQFFVQQIEAKGLRVNYGGMLRASLLADRIFRRHAFATPEYTVKAALSTLALELGDFVWLSHPLVVDFQSGNLGLNNVVCEVAGKQPNYAAGNVEYTLLDTRFMNETRPYFIAPASADVAPWRAATTGQRSTYLFIAQAATGGTYSDGTPGNSIF